jgi:sulfite reductase beta subunit
VKLVLRIIETWKADARDGERIATWINRIGWQRFFKKTGLPYFEQSMEDLDMRALVTLREGGRR